MLAFARSVQYHFGMGAKRAVFFCTRAEREKQFGMHMGCKIIEDACGDSPPPPCVVPGALLMRRRFHRIAAGSANRCKRFSEVSSSSLISKREEAKGFQNERLEASGESFSSSKRIVLSSRRSGGAPEAFVECRSDFGGALAGDVEKQTFFGGVGVICA